MIRHINVTFWDAGIPLLKDVQLNAVPREGDGIRIQGNDYTAKEIVWNMTALTAIVDVYL